MKQRTPDFPVRPVLLDKLCQKYSPDRSPPWRDILMRDIERILTNGVRNAQQQDIQQYGHARNSVLNFGMPQSLKVGNSTIAPELWAQHLLEVLNCFEPRLDPHSIRITPVMDTHDHHALTLMYDIHGTLLPKSENTPLHFRILFDYSCGAVRCVAQ